MKGFINQLKKIRFYLSGILVVSLIFGSLVFGAAASQAKSVEEDTSNNLITGQTTETVEQTLVNQPVAFEENRGQFKPQVRFQARGAGYTLFLTATEAVYALPLEENPKPPEIENLKSNILEEGQRTKNEGQKMFALRMKLAGANPDSSIAGEQILEQRTNYFKGGNPENWQTEVPNFGRVRFENVYEGVSLVWHGKDKGDTQYDFLVKPNADAGQISLEFDGAERLELDVEGNLLIHTQAGTIRHKKPFSYQETNGIKREIESRFVIADDSRSIGFALGEYDGSQPLTIDPTVNLSNPAYSTYLGGSAGDEGHAIAIDAGGNVYVTGETGSIDFPTTAGTFDPTFNGGTDDVFVTKLNPSGSTLLYSTYIGGDNLDDAFGIEVDESGNTYIAGRTFSSTINYPTTPGAFDTTYNGGTGDCFVTKLNSTGSSLLYSTFLGATNFDHCNDIAINTAGHAFVTGQTGSETFPTTAGAFDTTSNGSGDAFVTRINPAGGGAADLIYSTILGSNASDGGSGIAVDSVGNVYVTGLASDGTAGFPTTPGAFDTQHNGATDVFVSKINPAGSGSSDLIFSTFLGGSAFDSGNSIAVNSAGQVFVTGSTSEGATAFPTTANTFDPIHNGGTDVFVSKLNQSGSALVYSTFLGGTASDIASDIAIDATGNILLTGQTASPGFPTTAGAFSPGINGGNDAFLTKIIPLATGTNSMLYSTFVGGSGNDLGAGVAIDSGGSVYLTGNSASGPAAFYPTTAQAYQNFPAGAEDVIVSKFGNFSISGKVIDPTTGNPVSNVMIAMSGQTSGNLQTGADGHFSFLNAVNGAPHTIAASRSGYNLNPALFNIANLNNNRELTFLAQVGSPTGGSGGTLSFSAPAYSRGENGSFVTMTVNRTGNIITREPVTVDFTTASGTATDGQDFVSTSGVLTFNPLETSKTVQIPLINDSLLEPRESFTVTLSNPTNHADIEKGRESAAVFIGDEDLRPGNVLISEFRLRGRQGAADEFVELYNNTDTDVTLNMADNSDGLTLGSVSADGANVSPRVTIPNGTLLRARSYYLLVNNSPNGYSLAAYPTGDGATTATGNQSFSEDLPDDSNLVLLLTTNPANFNSDFALDAVGFSAGWTTEGAGLLPIGGENAETSFVRRIDGGQMLDTGDNRADFALVSDTGRMFYSSAGGTKSAIGAPAPQNSNSLRLVPDASAQISELVTKNGSEVFDWTPVVNGRLGTLNLYRTITNNGSQPITRLRLRVTDVSTSGNLFGRRSRADFRVLSSPDATVILPGDSQAQVKGLLLEEIPVQRAGGGLNSSLALSLNAPLQQGESVNINFRLGIQSYGKHRFAVALEEIR